MSTGELAGLRIGQALLILSVLATLPNLVRLGFLPIYWRKRGFFRWHMASGFFLSITYPYFALCLLRTQPANLALALGNALATIARCLSGQRAAPSARLSGSAWARPCP